MSNSLSFATLFDKATIVDSIYQKFSVSVMEHRLGEFKVRVCTSYSNPIDFESPAKAANHISKVMGVKKHYDELRTDVNKACNLIRDYGFEGADYNDWGRSDLMLKFLDQLGDFLKHYEHYER